MEVLDVRGNKELNEIPKPGLLPKHKPTIIRSIDDLPKPMRRQFKLDCKARNKKTRLGKDHLSKMGIPSNRHRNVKCPCKSGKKWKKCCGRLK